MVAALTGLAALIVALFMPAAHAADAWDISEDYAGVAIAEAHWTIDEAFPGTKVILDGRYSLRATRYATHSRKTLSPISDRAVLLLRAA